MFGVLKMFWSIFLET